MALFFATVRGLIVQNKIVQRSPKDYKIDLLFYDFKLRRSILFMRKFFIGNSKHHRLMFIHTLMSRNS